MKTAFLFPGQGSQYVNMLSSIYVNREAQNILNSALKIVNKNIEFLHSEKALSTTTAVQQCLLICEVAAFQALKSIGARPSFLAGHSVGAFSAAVCSDVLSFEDALRIVTLRGQLMEINSDSSYGMGVVIGLTEDQLEPIVTKINTNEYPVYVSNRNARTQIALSGSLVGIERVFKQVEKLAKVKMIKVSTPSHCPIFSEVAVQLKNALKSCEIKKPKIPIISNVNSRVIYNAEAVIEDLAMSISAPVRWYEGMQLLAELGVELFVEMPPGEILTKLSKNIFPEKHAVALETMNLEDCLYLMNL